MPTKNKSEKYDRAEITFSRLKELDQKLYNHLVKKSKVIGKGAYLKQLLYNDMISGKGE